MSPKVIEMMKTTCLLLALAIFAPAMWAQSPASSDLSSGPVPDADSAIQIALNFTGFDKTAGFSLNKIQTPSRVQAEQDRSIGFLHQMINGRPAWQVEFRDIYYSENRQGLESTVTDPRDFEVLIYTETGCLLKIISFKTKGALGADTGCWENIEVPDPSTGGRTILFAPDPQSHSFTDVLEFGLGSWVPEPAELEAFYFRLVQEDNHGSESVGADTTDSMWFILSKDIMVDPYRPNLGLECVVEFWCFDGATGRPGGCGGYTAKAIR
jgi:hypothetical protein